VTRVVWGRGLIEPDVAHIRETRAGGPITYLADGTVVGYALCGAWLVGDVEPDAAGLARCSRCLEIVADIEQGGPSPPTWSADE
jgi:hypothetical protein